VDGVTLADTTLRALDERLPEVWPTLCVATRYQASTCRRCLEVCPGGAVTPSPWLSVDGERCVSCGACAAVCRTGALDFPQARAALAEAVAEVARQGEPAVSIACVRTNLREDLAWPHVAVGCLGALSEGDLVGACRRGAERVWLIHADCSRCQLSLAVARIQDVAEAAVAAVAAFGLHLDVDIVDVPAQAGAAAAPALVLSRRGLFSFIARRAGGAALTTTDAQRPDIATLHAQAAPPAAHRRLLGDLEALSAMGAAGAAASPAVLPSADVVVGASCDGCGLCLRYCPHGALSLDGGRPAVDRALCTGCGLCAEVCPPGALALCPGTLGA